MSDKDNNLNDNISIEDTKEGQAIDDNDQEPEIFINNPKGLVSALEKTKLKLNQINSAREEAENKLRSIQTAMGDLTPEQIKQIHEKQLLSEQRFTEVIDQKNDEIASLTSELQKSLDQLNNQTLQYELEKAFHLAEGIEGHFCIIRNELLNRSKIVDGKLLILDDNGEIPLDSELKRKLTPAEAIAKMYKTDTIYSPHFKNDHIKGTGASSVLNNKPGVSRSALSEIKSATERIAFARANGIVN